MLFLEGTRSSGEGRYCWRMAKEFYSERMENSPTRGHDRLLKDVDVDATSMTEGKVIYSGVILSRVDCMVLTILIQLGKNIWGSFTVYYGRRGKIVLWRGGGLMGGIWSEGRTVFRAPRLSIKKSEKARQDSANRIINS